MAIQRTLGEATRFPGGKKIAGLVVLVVVLMGMLFWNPSRDDEGLPPELQGIGDSATNLDRLTEELGLGDLGDLSGDAPVDLAGLPSGAGVSPSSPGESVPGAETPIPVPTPPVATPLAPPRVLREIDHEKVRAAFLAGDAVYLASVFRDETYRLPGRNYVLTLASLLEDDAVEAPLQEVFEGTGEPFSLRETAAYGLMTRDPLDFAAYLLRVLGRPAVASGQDGTMSRLVVLSFFLDRWAQGGKALDLVGDKLMELARRGSVTANAALSFGLSGEGDRSALLAQLRNFDRNPTVSDNLQAFYEVMVGQGRQEFAGALESLRSQSVDQL